MKNYMKVGARKLLMGLVPARVWRGQPVGIFAFRKVEVEEAAGGSSRQERDI